jgi:hypothetical protein
MRHSNMRTSAEAFEISRRRRFGVAGHDYHTRLYDGVTRWDWLAILRAQAARPNANAVDLERYRSARCALALLGSTALPTADAHRRPPCECCGGPRHY